MASSLFSGRGQLSQLPQGNDGMFGHIRQFARMIGSRDPQKMVMALMRQRGIPVEQLNAAMEEARGIAQQMGIM